MSKNIYKAKRRDNGEWVTGIYRVWTSLTNNNEHSHTIDVPYEGTIFYIEIYPETLSKVDNPELLEV